MKRDRAAPWALGAVVLYFVSVATSIAFVQTEAWDLRAFAEDPIDATWRLELAWRALHGEWSYVDFHYPRGPLWQLVGFAAALASPDDPPLTLALLYLFFHVATLGLLLGLVLRFVERPWPRVLVFFACAFLSNASGIATFRGFLPLLVILSYAPRTLETGEDPRPWRSAFFAAGWTALATLVSFDRLYAMVFCVTAIVLAEVALRARARDPIAPAFRRLGRYVLACAVCFGALALLGLALGADPIEAVLAQRTFASAYSSHMATEWRVAVPAANVVGLFLASTALVVIPRIRAVKGATRLDALWIVGALPAVSFGVIRADSGHMIVSMIPALTVLFLLAGGASATLPSSRRWLAGGLASVAVVGWFGAYPANLAGHPRAFVELAAVLEGQKGPDRGYRTEHGEAIRWARERARLYPGACIAVSADMSIVHPFTNTRGPTELAMRWSNAMKVALAEAIESARCPSFVYSIKTYDYPGDSWALGPDFVRVAQMYEVEERLGVGLLGMRLRDEPLEVERRSLSTEPLDEELALPGELRVPLRELARGTDIVDLELELDVPLWRAVAGGTPHVEWRFERDGVPVSEWDHLYQVMLGRPSRVQVSPDPEAAEVWWMTGASPSRSREADTLALRVSPRGLASPGRARLVVRRVERLRLERSTRPPPLECETRRDLLDDVRRGAAFTRYVSPHAGNMHFNLEPSPPNRRLAEVVWPIAPCADTCLFVGAAVPTPPGRSDGVELEVHVLDLPDRVLLRRDHIPPGGEERRFEIALGAFSGREALLRIGTLSGPAWAEDYAKIVRPRLDRCSARRAFYEADEAGELEVIGDAHREGGDFLVGAGGAELRAPLTIARDTCFATGLEVSPQGPAHLSIRGQEGALEHVFFDGELAAGDHRELSALDLFDFTSRAITLVVEVRPRVAGGRVRLGTPRLHACR